MNTVFFSDYDSGCYSSALLLTDGVDWDTIDSTTYEVHIPDAYEIVDYDDKKLFAFFSQMFNAEIQRIIIAVNGEVVKVRCSSPRGFFGYEMFDGKILREPIKNA